MAFSWYLILLASPRVPIPQATFVSATFFISPIGNKLTDLSTASLLPPGGRRGLLTTRPPRRAAFPINGRTRHSRAAQLVPGAGGTRLQLCMTAHKAGPKPVQTPSSSPGRAPDPHLTFPSSILARGARGLRTCPATCPPRTEGARRRAGVTWLLPFRLWPAGRGRLLARRVEPRAGSPSSPLPARATKEFADAG